MTTRRSKRKIVRRSPWLGRLVLIGLALAFVQALVYVSQPVIWIPISQPVNAEPLQSDRAQSNSLPADSGPGKAEDRTPSQPKPTAAPDMPGESGAAVDTAAVLAVILLGCPVAGVLLARSFNHAGKRR